jgi:hypothetical protein
MFSVSGFAVALSELATSSHCSANAVAQVQEPRARPMSRSLLACDQLTLIATVPVAVVVKGTNARMSHICPVARAVAGSPRWNVPWATTVVTGAGGSVVGVDGLLPPPPHAGSTATRQTTAILDRVFPVRVM